MMSRQSRLGKAREDEDKRRRPRTPQSAEYGGNGKPAHPLLGEHLTDAGNARRFAHLHGMDLRYCHPWQKWLSWVERCWREDDAGTPEALAKATARAMLERAAKHA